MIEKLPGRVARCSCGAAAIHVAGEPRNIYGCACIECQRATGTAFAYRAIFPDEAVLSIEGELRSWRRVGDAGRWLDQFFCPECGALLFMTAEAMAGAISVSVGCFDDPEFGAPGTIHNLHRAPRWFALAEATQEAK